MVRNRIFALIYRIACFAVILSGLIIGSSYNSGATRFLFYTAQSNILACALFLMLIIRTLVGLIKNGVYGSAGYFPRVEMAVTLMITFTLIVYWCALAPFLPGRIWTYGNIALHAAGPLFCIVDYLFFCEAGMLKKRDIGLSLLLPLIYFAVCTVIGFAGTVFYVHDGIPHYFPYYFMDYHYVGFMGVVYLAAIALVYAVFAIFIYRIDRRWKKPALFAGRTVETVK